MRNIPHAGSCLYCGTSTTGWVSFLRGYRFVCGEHGENAIEDAKNALNEAHEAFEKVKAADAEKGEK